MQASQVNCNDRLSRSVFEKALAVEPYQEWVKGICPFAISALVGGSIDFAARSAIAVCGKGAIEFAAVAWDIKDYAAVGWLPELLGAIGCFGAFILLVNKDDKAYEYERYVYTILQKYHADDFISPGDIRLLKRYAPPTVWNHMYKKEL